MRFFGLERLFTKEKDDWLYKPKTGEILIASGDIHKCVLKVFTTLGIRHFRNGLNGFFEILPDARIIYNRKFTEAAAAYIVDSMSNSTTTPLDVLKYHDSGTGTNAENKTDTALQTATGVARVAGTVTQPSAMVNQSVAEITYDGSYAVTEHGVFSAAAAGTLLDRTVFAAVNVVNTDKIEFTFQLTFAGET